jgi:hypothetical protein
VTLNNGSVPNSSATGALAAGRCSYIAVCNGDRNNKSVVGAVEPLTVNPATISGFKWDDANGNGKWDSGEVSVNAVTFQLYQKTNGATGLQFGTGGDTLVATTTTATNNSYNGFYSFSVTALGTYYIKEVVPTGWVSTTPNPVTFIEKDADVTGRYGYTDLTYFGDAHITTGSGKAGTMGFWKNSQGEMVLTGSSTGQQLSSKYVALFTGALANPNKPAYTVLVDGNGNYIAQSYFTSTKKSVQRRGDLPGQRQCHQHGLHVICPAAGDGVQHHRGKREREPVYLHPQRGWRDFVRPECPAYTAQWPQRDHREPRPEFDPDFLRDSGARDVSV